MEQAPPSRASQSESGDPPSRLSEIETLWSVVFQAHQGEEDEARAAQARLMFRYLRAVRRYLLGVVRDPDTADDLTQDFSLRFLRGDFRRADPDRGRFRDFVKTAVLNLVVDYHRRRMVRPVNLPPNAPEPADPGQEPPNLDGPFLESWRQELFNRAWAALALHQRESHQPYHDVLTLRAERPELTSSQMAELLSTQLGKAVNAGWVRQMLLRAREKYADLLLEEVCCSLEYPSTEEVEQELIVLNMLDYCRKALDRRLSQKVE
jgi:RNA polymerase sigma-70 factor (ECF subfamily)